MRQKPEKSITRSKVFFSGCRLAESEKSSISTVFEKIRKIVFANFPLGGAKGQTLDLISGHIFDRKWMKFGGKVDLGHGYLGSKRHVSATHRGPPRNFGVFRQKFGGCGILHPTVAKITFFSCNFSNQ